MRIKIDSTSNIEAAGKFKDLFSKLRKRGKKDSKAPQASENAGDSPEYLLDMLLNDPGVKIGKPDKVGNQDIFYKHKHLGWINGTRGTARLNFQLYKELMEQSTPKEDLSVDNSSARNWKDDDIIRASDDISDSNSIETKSDLMLALKDTLDSSSCYDVVMTGISEDGAFADDEFFDSGTFFDIYGNTDAQELVEAFYDGEDLDDKSEKHANPHADYIRWSMYGIESTDDAGQYYYDNLLDDIIDFIMDHLDDGYDFPSDVQDLIDEYLENQDDDDDEVYDDDEEEEEENPEEEE